LVLCSFGLSDALGSRPEWTVGLVSLVQRSELD
jgi:hypothetical protein